MFIEDTKYGILGLESHFEGNEIYFSYPNSIFVGQKVVLMCFSGLKNVYITNVLKLEPL